MRQRLLLLLLLGTTLGPFNGQAQILRGPLPGRSVSGQYAGSIGLMSVGVMRHTANERIGVGLSFGHTPKPQGGPLNSWTLRFMYTPWRVDINERWRLEPLQTGFFVAYTTGLDLRSSWPSHLEPGYYWWSPNFRQHLYLRTQLSFRTRGHSVQRIAAYFEVNTNDLYVYSWWPNRNAITVGDILFFGAGVQVYFTPFTPRPSKAKAQFQRSGPVHWTVHPAHMPSTGATRTCLYGALHRSANGPSGPETATTDHARSLQATPRCAHEIERPGVLDESDTP